MENNLPKVILSSKNNKKTKTIPYLTTGKTPFNIMVSMIDVFLKKRGFQNKSLIENWKSIVGEEMGSKCLPIKIVKKTKTIHISSQDLEFKSNIRYNEAKMCERINTYLGYSVVSKVRLS